MGSQLIAKTFGANVYPGSKNRIGFYHDLQFLKALLFSQILIIPSLFFTGMVTLLIYQKVLLDLAYSKFYPNQAFQYKSAVGLQFHLEVNEEMVNLWLDNTKEKLEKLPDIDPQKIRFDINNNISSVKSNMKNFYNNFKRSFGL